MKIYEYLEKGDRRSNVWKEISRKYEALCVKDGSRFMETKEAREYANKNFHLKTLLDKNQ